MKTIIGKIKERIELSKRCLSSKIQAYIEANDYVQKKYGFGIPTKWDPVLKEEVIDQDRLKKLIK